MPYQYIEANPQIKPVQNRHAALPIDAGEPPHIGLVLDCSGSMEALRTETVRGFNILLDQQRTLSVSPPANFSLELVDSDVRMIYDAISIIDVPPLSLDTYRPTGGTALNDGIGHMIQSIGKQVTRSSRVLVAIVTDGQENSSRTFSAADILQMISYRRLNYDWQFVFMGPKDALSYSLSIGIPKTNVFGFDANPATIAQLLGRLNKAVSAYLLGDRRYFLALKDSNNP